LHIWTSRITKEAFATGSHYPAEMRLLSAPLRQGAASPAAYYKGAITATNGGRIE